MSDAYIPSDWRKVRLAEIADVVRGSSPRPAGDPRYFNGDHLPWVTVADVTKDGENVLRHTESMLTRDGAEQTRILERGTLLLTNSGAMLGVPRILGIRAGANDGIAAFLNLQEASSWYLLYFLQTQTRLFRERIAPGVGQPNLNTELIGNMHVPLPPPDEQRQIVRVLKTWDDSLLGVAHLLKLKRRLKRGLMQQLLTGRRRFREFASKPWRECRLRDVAEECSIRNRGALGIDAVMAVTKASGMIPMRPETIASSIERYQIVRRDWFAYNPMRLNIGSIARWQGERDVMVSPDYVVFRCKDDELDSDYLHHYRRSHVWTSFMNACGNGSVRVRIWFADLGVLKLRLPPIDEQRKIASLLNTADREIDLLEQQLAALRKQKKGLMQKLLTGKVRLKLTEEKP